ncbi:MAG: O-antigen ligase family protein [bacterium]|nr:O-antigen ligase family protein [bacterium]
MKVFSRQNNLLAYGLYLLVFLLPLQTRWMIKLGNINGGYWEYGTMSLYAADILIMAMLLDYFIRKEIRHLESNDLNRKKVMVWLLIGGLELIIFISIFFAVDLGLAVYGYARFLLAIGFFFLVTQVKHDKIRLYYAVIFSGLIQSIFALQQYITQSVYANKWLGMAAQSAGDLGVSVTEVGDERWLRAYGTLPHPNMLGGFLAVALLINILLYLKLFYKLEKSEDDEESKRYRWQILLVLFIFTISFVGLLLTYSRGAWLAFLVGLIFLAPTVVNKYRWVGFFNLAKFFIIITVVGALFAYAQWGQVQSRFGMNNERLEKVSVFERLVYAQDAETLIKNNLFFGVGIGNYGRAVYDRVDEQRSAYYYQPVHNVFLLVIAEIGVFGLGFFTALILYLLRLAYQRRGFGKIAILFAVITIMFFDHWLWSLAFGGYLFWLIMGISLNKEDLTT